MQPVLSSFKRELDEEMRFIVCWVVAFLQFCSLFQLLVSLFVRFCYVQGVSKG